MNTTVKRYMSRLKREIGKTDPRKEALLEEIGADLEEYAAAHEKTDYRALCGHFGKPSELASWFDEPGDTIRDRKSAKKTVLRIVLIVALAALFAYSAYLIHEIIRNTEGTYTEITIEALEGK